MREHAISCHPFAAIKGSDGLKQKKNVVCCEAVLNSTINNLEFVISKSFFIKTNKHNLRVFLINLIKKAKISRNFFGKCSVPYRDKRVKKQSKENDKK